jgi:hypothetical protein
MRVGNVEAGGMNVTELRNIIVGDQGTRVPVRFRCVCVRQNIYQNHRASSDERKLEYV